MTEVTVISIDVMGGDFGPPVVLAGLALDANHWRASKVRFLLHGDEQKIVPELTKHGGVKDLCVIRHTARAVSMDEKPAQAVRRGKGSSLWNSIEAIRAGDAHAAVSAGNSGALMAISKLILRMIADHLERPAFVASWPSARGATTVLDVGANIDCDAARLVEFAIMGEAFHRAVRGIDRPRVGLLNVGAEDQKGHDDVREAHQLLRDRGLVENYVGFVEGGDIYSSIVDVIVTDGFTGNVALKTAEGTSRFLLSEVRAALTSSLRGRIGGLFAKSPLRRMLARLEPERGVPLLGLAGIVVKAHGGADATAFASAVRVAVALARSAYLDEIARNLSRVPRATTVTSA